MAKTWEHSPPVQVCQALGFYLLTMISESGDQLGTIEEYAPC